MKALAIGGWVMVGVVSAWAGMFMVALAFPAVSSRGAWRERHR